MESFTERIEGPEGQYVVLLTRFPYDRALTIESAFDRTRHLGERADAVLRAALWEVKVKDYLTGEDTVDIDRGDPAMIADWRDRAVELYSAWRKIALPGPKGSTGTASRTRTSPKAAASAMSGQG